MSALSSWTRSVSSEALVAQIGVCDSLLALPERRVW